MLWPWARRDVCAKSAKFQRCDSGNITRKVWSVDRFSFNDFEQYADAIRDVDCRFTLTGREEADWLSPRLVLEPAARVLSCNSSTSGRTMSLSTRIEFAALVGIDWGDTKHDSSLPSMGDSASRTDHPHSMAYAGTLAKAADCRQRPH